MHFSWYKACLSSLNSVFKQQWFFILMNTNLSICSFMNCAFRVFFYEIWCSVLSKLLFVHCLLCQRIWKAWDLTLLVSHSSLHVGTRGPWVRYKGLCHSWHRRQEGLQLLMPSQHQIECGSELHGTLGTEWFCPVEKPQTWKS